MPVVAYCHDKGIIHHDLKIENILFPLEAIDSPIKIIDLGFSVLLGKKQNLKNEEKNTDGNNQKKFVYKRLKSKVGTLYYISPEIIKGNYDEKCDIWACGIILYILLVGKPPFSGNTDKEVPYSSCHPGTQF